MLDELGRVNPVIVIPSYWSRTDDLVAVGDVGIYDHSTPISKPLPELETCLQSLEQVRGVLRVIVLVVAPPAYADSARARVDGICRQHPNLNPLVIGQPEAQEVMRLVERVAPGLEGEPCSLRGYGAIRNMGLAVAAALGHDVVVFLDDDEIALNEDFLIDAVYGIGLETRQGLPIQAKSGYYLDREDSPYADVSSRAGTTAGGPSARSSTSGCTARSRARASRAPTTCAAAALPWAPRRSAAWRSTR